MSFRGCAGVPGERCGPGRVEGPSVLGGADRSRSDPLGSGVTAVVQQRRSSDVRRWFLSFPILRGLWLWRFRSDRGGGDPERDLSLLRFGAVLWSSAWCGGVGARRRRGWLFAADVLCGRLGGLGRSTVFGPLGCFIDSSIVCSCLVRISPSSVERGFGSKPLLWFLGRGGGVPSLWLLFEGLLVCLVMCCFVLSVWLSQISPYSFELGFWCLGLVRVLWFSQDLNSHLGGQSNGEKLPHMVWRFWVMVLEGVAFFLRLAVGLCVVSWVRMDDVPLIWRYFRGLYVLLSVVSCWQRDCHLFLHVVWLGWDTVLLVGRWLLVMLDAGSDRDSRKWSYVVARVEGRLGWLGVGPAWLMDVIVDDGPVTEVVLWERCGDFISTTECSHLL